MSGGVAYVLDEKRDLYLRLNKELVSMDLVTEKHDIEELKALIASHVAATGSQRGKEILDNFETYLPFFKKILPHDYDRMLKSIGQMEEKGMSREMAEVEAFYANVKGGAR
jgi:glutamate synthase (ferredoxin)